MLVARGWLTENSNEWSEAMQAVERRYPDSPVYRVHWGSKEQKALAALALKGSGGGAAGAGAFARRPQGQQIRRQEGPFLGGALAVAEVAKESLAPLWSVPTTGVLLASILARTEIDRCILVGHSLGGRVMITAAETLGTDPDAPHPNPARSAPPKAKKGDWRPLNDAVEDAVHNYYSANDKVLEIAYRTAQVGDKAIGRYSSGRPSQDPRSRSHRPRRRPHRVLRERDADADALAAHAGVPSTMSDAPVRVFIVDDHELVRRGLRDLLGTAGDLDVIGEAATVAEALVGITNDPPDVAVLDVRLPDGSGVELCREVRSTCPTRTV